MKNNFKKLFLIFAIFLLPASSHAFPEHINNPEAYHDLLMSIHTSDPIATEKAFTKEGIKAYLELLELAQNIVSIHMVRRMITDSVDKKEADNAFATLKVIVKELVKRTPASANEDSRIQEMYNKTQRMLNQTLDEFYAENHAEFGQIDKISELELAIAKEDLNTIKALITHPKAHKNKNHAINLCVLMLHIQGFKVAKKYSSKTTPLTLDDLCAQDLRIFEITYTVCDALATNDRKKNFTFLAEMPPLEFYEKFRNPTQ